MSNGDQRRVAESPSSKAGPRPGVPGDGPYAPELRRWSYARHPFRNLPALPAVSALVSRLAVYAALIVTARILDAEEFGQLTVLLALLGVFSALVAGGGDMWLNRVTFGRRSVAGQAPRLWFGYLVVVSAISAGLIVIAAIVTLVAGDLLPWSTALLTVVLVAAFMGSTDAVLAILRAGGAIRFFFVTRDLVAPVALIGLILLIQPQTAMGVLYVYMALWAVTTIAVLGRLIWSAPSTLPAVRPPRFVWRPLVVHTLGLVYGNMTSRLSMHVDIFVLATFVTLTQVGEYRVAAQFAMGFMVVQHFLFLGLPWQMRPSGDHPLGQLAAQSVAQRQTSLMLIAALAGGAIWLFAEPLLALFGDRFVGITDVFRILLIVRFASILWGPQHEILISSGHSVLDAHANIVALALWAATFLVTIQSFDPLAAAILANIAGSFASHLTRHVTLHWYGLPKIFGHPFGVALPVLAYLVAALLSVGVLPI